MTARDLAAVTVAVGLILMTAAAFLYDWRAGLFITGVVLVGVGLVGVDVTPDKEAPPQ